ncbi:hypothetical protein C0216_12075 [Streptomyces globosus]|uniref:ParB-like N-terminal domain-containing protein n=1 Tax=Streptomyces globosus TaxID=68209 RepID=A0A344U985_9ACTN|nr:hypothetical protein C0216_12075 [Streptomyces globosus]
MPQVHRVSVTRLRPADSPRLAGIDAEHVRRLTETSDALPPILVHRATMRVIDGMHRLHAAVLRGRHDIEALYFDGSPDEAFRRAVQENIAHGLPLSLSDRKAAARRILTADPQISDRAVAACVGLSGKTVAALRRLSGAESAHLNTRIGADGRSYPLDGTRGRLLAVQLIAERPDAPLREIARDAGVSVGTAHTIRGRIRRGETPVPAGSPAAQELRASLTPSAPESAPALSCRAFPEVLRSLSRDPSLRSTEAGRQLLRWLHTQPVLTDDWHHRLDALPAHCTDSVAALARKCAEVWQQIAREVERPKGR